MQEDETIPSHTICYEKKPRGWLTAVARESAERLDRRDHIATLNSILDGRDLEVRPIPSHARNGLQNYRAMASTIIPVTPAAPE